MEILSQRWQDNSLFGGCERRATKLVTRTAVRITLGSPLARGRFIDIHSRRPAYYYQCRCIRRENVRASLFEETPRTNETIVMNLGPYARRGRKSTMLPPFAVFSRFFARSFYWKSTLTRRNFPNDISIDTGRTIHRVESNERPPQCKPDSFGTVPVHIGQNIKSRALNSPSGYRCAIDIQRAKHTSKRILYHRR